MSAKWDTIAVVRDSSFKMLFENLEDALYEKGPNFAQRIFLIEKKGMDWFFDEQPAPVNFFLKHAV